MATLQRMACNWQWNGFGAATADLHQSIICELVRRSTEDVLHKWRQASDMDCSGVSELVTSFRHVSLQL
jgi:hypothetical protein